MRSKEAFAYSRSIGYFYSVAALPATANKEKAPAARPELGWDLTDRRRKNNVRTFDHGHHNGRRRRHRRFRAPALFDIRRGLRGIGPLSSSAELTRSFCDDFLP